MFLQSSNSSRPHSTSPCCSAASILTCCCANLLHYQIPSFTSQNHWFVAFFETPAQHGLGLKKYLLLLESDFKLTANKLKIQSPQWNRSLKSGRLRSVYLFNREGEVLLQMFDSPNLSYLIQSAAQKQHCFWCASWHPSSNHKRVAVFSNSLDLPLVAGWLSSVDFEDQDQCWF